MPTSSHVKPAYVPTSCRHVVVLMNVFTAAHYRTCRGFPCARLKIALASAITIATYCRIGGRSRHECLMKLASRIVHCTREGGMYADMEPTHTSSSCSAEVDVCANMEVAHMPKWRQHLLILHVDIASDEGIQGGCQGL